MIVSGNDITEFCRILRDGGKTVVFTNGCFDILHAGHVRYLNTARSFGDCLVLGLNSDASVRRLKGPERPINCQDDRAEVIDALACVDYVVIFEEQTAEAIISKVKPDVY
ncbi:MAG: adenylyltransferase/cytidyltransferase family protein, partial [Selenomonadaceae bacterium]|nr:adenylyltransferase/cytidyltransferase family protein [Selenomonadaceae bacterium]